MHLHKVKLTSWYNSNNRAVRNLTLLGFLGVGGLTYLKVWLPLTGIGIPCVFREVTGFLCPGCGMTRLVLALLEFDIAQAFRYNMLVFFLVPLYFLYLMLEWRNKSKHANILIRVMLIMTIVFGILRNTPYFSWLAPTVI